MFVSSARVGSGRVRVVRLGSEVIRKAYATEYIFPKLHEQSSL